MQTLQFLIDEITKEYQYDITKLLYPEANYNYAGRNTMKFLFQKAKR